ncbi:hypothetical protein CPC08DRAFT_176540 [Agrocybe pediades]|nr:hypothetical protein CPC08DRAFT_176540 [Agrocybe pediades]
MTNASYSVIIKLWYHPLRRRGYGTRTIKLIAVSCGRRCQVGTYQTWEENRLPLRLLSRPSLFRSPFANFLLHECASSRQPMSSAADPDQEIAFWGSFVIAPSTPYGRSKLGRPSITI